VPGRAAAGCGRTALVPICLAPEMKTGGQATPACSRSSLPG